MAAIAVARYTLLELSRRRLLLVFAGIAVLLTAGLGLAPLFLPGMSSADDRAVFVLGGISRVDGLAIELCAFAIGMTVINHDLDSGAIVAILAKPVTRLSYALGKLAAALFLVLLIVGVFTAGSLLVVALDGGGHANVLFWFFATNAANFMLLMVLVMILTVYLNNIVAAAIVVAFSFVQNQVSILHTMVQSNVITDHILRPAVEAFFSVVPHQLLSNLDRDIAIANFNANCATGCPGMKPSPALYLADQLSRIPGASGSGDAVYWLAYLLVVCAILYVALRRKQV
jgi:ABC-type transport system involved in multi-copper enzyme maturation permease subunit